MRRFRFRLDRILQLRRYREREKQLELAAATARCVELQNLMKESTAQSELELRRRAPEAGVIDMVPLQISELFRRRLSDQYAQAAEDLVDRQEERKRAQSRYLEASRDRKVLEKLKEKRASQHKSDQRSEDFAEMDDVTQSRGRSQGQGD